MKQALFFTLLAFSTSTARAASAAPLLIGESGPPSLSPSPISLTDDRPGAPAHFAPRTSRWSIDASLRTTFVNHPGFDALGGAQGLVEPGLTVTREIWRQHKLALAVGVLGELGALGGKVRGGAETSMLTTRLEAIVEGRYHLVSWAFLFARVAPGAQSTHVSLTDPSSTVGMSTTQWRPSFDASIGGALSLGGDALTWWLGADFGWTWTPDIPMLLTADVAKDDPRAFGTVDLGSFAARGLSSKLWLGVSF
jgi:hypothetical protein